ncbi:MAG: ORF6N domain-containing protein [Patescibacteria group bacterium]
MKKIVTTNNIQDQIYTVRNTQVMFDRDLASLYEVSTKRLNEQVKRNIGRFPEEFRFQLTEDEKNEVVANCDHLENLKFSPYLPHVFTEQGVAMLSSVLKSEVAVKMSVQIMQAFVVMRNFLIKNASIFNRFENIEQKQFKTDKTIQKIFKALEDKSLKPKQGIFYDGQIFDAYMFVADLIKSAKKSIVLIDNFADESVLQLFVKRKKGVKATIYTNKLSKTLELDLKRHNDQYELIEIKLFNKAHDRFLIIDNRELYHIGASLKDLGKKWFAFSRMDSLVGEVSGKLKHSNSS